MKINVNDCLKLDAFRGASVIACRENCDRRVRTISVLDEDDLDMGVQRNGVKDQMVITHFWTSKDDADAQAKAVKELGSKGISALVVYLNDRGVTSVAPKTIEAAESVGLPLITINDTGRVTYSMLIEEVLDKILYADAEKIKQTAETIDREAFDRAVDALINARNIYILGVRSSASLADFLGAGLLRVSDNVKLIRSTSGSEVFEQMLDIGEQDVLVAISFPRYSKRVVTAVEFAHRAGANVVSLTDSARAPIAAQADQLLLAQSDVAAFVDSLVAPLSIINALLVAISRKKQGELTERLRRLEHIWDEYEVYDKSR